MNVGELIKALESLPQDAPVKYLWDGYARSEIRHVWFTQCGYVVVSDDDEVVYSDCDRPKFVLSSKDDPYWATPKTQEKE